MKTDSTYFTGLLFWLLLAMTAWAYWPGLSGPALLDDSVNLEIVSKLDQESGFYGDLIFGNRSGPLGRPVAMASFVLEKLYMDRGLRGNKTVSLGIHLLTACLVFWLAFKLIAYCRFSRPDIGAIYVTAFWLLTPMFVSTVLYPVQRMAQLSTLFSLIALLFYCFWRERPSEIARAWLLLPLMVLSIAAATLSKENGLLVILLIAVLELFIFRFSVIFGESSHHYKKYLCWTAGALVFGAISSVVMLWSQGYLVEGYSLRDFTLAERVMTELRILWHYIFQLLIPDTLVMGIYHDDFLISRNFISPISTALAAVAWVVSLAICTYFYKTRLARLLLFSIFFYLAAHALESTIIPLELYFEHRNYLPAFGIYFAISILFLTISDRHPPLKNTVIVVFSVWIAAFTFATTAQAYVWSNKYLFQFGAFANHPHSVRAKVETARLMAEQQEIGQALEISSQVRHMQTDHPLRHDSRDLILYCLAGSAPDPSLWVDMAGRKKSFTDGQLNENIQLLVELLVEGRCRGFDLLQVAEQFTRIFFAESGVSNTRKILIMMAILENHNGRYLQADNYAKTLLKKYPGDIKALLMRLYFTNVLGKNQEKFDIVKELLEYRESGHLSREQQYTLELFL